MNARIRRATPEDAMAIATVKVRGWQQAYRGIFSDRYLDALDVESTARRFEAWRKDPGWTAIDFVLEEGAQAMGWASMQPPSAGAEERAAELRALYVLSERWGYGYGYELLKHCVSEVADPADSLYLWVLEDQPQARRFYERQGFVFTGERKAWIAKGSEEPPAWVVRYERPV